MKFWSTLFLVSISSIGLAQDTDNSSMNWELNRWYMGIGGGFATDGTLGNVYLGLAFKNNWGFRLNYMQEAIESPDEPDDYAPGGIINIFPSAPSDYLDNYALLFTHEFYNHHRSVTWAAEMGPGIAIYKTAHYKKRTGWNWFEENYDVTYSLENSVSLMAQIRFNWYLARWMGVELAAIGNLNKFKPYGGLVLNLNFGKTGKRVH